MIVYINLPFLVFLAFYALVNGDSPAKPEHFPEPISQYLLERFSALRRYFLRNGQMFFTIL